MQHRTWTPGAASEGCFVIWRFGERGRPGSSWLFSICKLRIVFVTRLSPSPATPEFHRTCWGGAERKLATAGRPCEARWEVPPDLHAPFYCLGFFFHLSHPKPDPVICSHVNRGLFDHTTHSHVHTHTHTLRQTTEHSQNEAEPHTRSPNERLPSTNQTTHV